MEDSNNAFSKVENAEGAKMEVRLIQEKGKVAEFELKIRTWLPVSVCKRMENGNYSIPYWIIAKSINKS